MYQMLADNVHKLKRKSRLGQIIVVILASQLLCLSSFLGFKLPIATASNVERFWYQSVYQLWETVPANTQEQVFEKLPQAANYCQNCKAWSSGGVRYTNYVPQAPLAIFVGYALGPVLGCLAGCIFLVIGLVGPLLNLHIFSAGGTSYYTQPSFGYLLGMVLACFVTGKLTKDKADSVRQLWAVLAGLACVHLTGLLYLFSAYFLSGMLSAGQASLIFGSSTGVPWSQWVSQEARNFTYYPLPFDVIFSFCAIGLGFPFRWLVSILTAPDIGSMRVKQPQKLEEYLP